ncbi:MAG: elongation factor G [Nitrospiraceae bacterium]
MSAGPGAVIRNVALVSYSGAGKTSLAEALAFGAGIIPAPGSVSLGTTLSDFEPEEQHRQHSFSTALLQLSYRHHTLSILDTPGERNFQGETLAALRAVDSVIIVINSVMGIRPQLIRLWEQVRLLRLPALVFLTDLEHAQVPFEALVRACAEALEVMALPVVLPVGQGEQFEAVADVLAGSLLKSSPESNRVQTLPLPEACSAPVAEAKRQLIEAAAVTDDALLEAYLAGGELAMDQIHRGLATAVHSGRILPVLCGSAVRHLGIQSLLDSIVQFLPAPTQGQTDRFAQAVHPNGSTPVLRQGLPDEKFSALVFKTIIDPFMGRMTYIRVCSGSLQADTPVFNTSRQVRERGGHLFTVVGKKYQTVPVLSAGQIGAIGKLKDTQTGDTLCDETDPVVFPALPLPRPVLSYALEPKSKADIEKVSLGLHKLVEEDPTLALLRNDETKELVLSGLGQVHIDVAVERLRRKYGVEVELHTPRVPYKETIRSASSAQGKYKKQTGGHGQYGDCWLQLTPLERGTGFKFENKIVGGAIPRNFIPAVEKGIVEAMHEGVLAGFPVVDLQVTVYDGSYHVVDSSELAFKIAASMGFKKAMEAAHPILLEPLMHVEVSCPDEFVGAVIGDLNGRRGRIVTVTAKGHTESIEAIVPLAEMLRYASSLNGLTGGRADYAMELSGYEEVPRDQATRVIEEAKASRHAVA